ncbi:aminotransferase class I/II-fold pyridoxal phosphate-dependent enzyme [Eionea flava]
MNNKKESDLPLHGGDIVSASMRYHIPIDQWVDLSTGINPEHYPIDSVNINDYCRLPYISHDFYTAAQNYYLPNQLKNSLLAVAGTQVAIQTLPHLLTDHPVLIPDIGYQEHRSHWQKNHSTIINYPAETLSISTEFIERSIEKNKRQHLVIINPNNPSGVVFNKLQLIEWAKKIDRSAYIIIDEAFIDSTPENSVLTESLPSNIIVLRSFGKFFGLAGIRLGFVFACSSLIQSLQEAIGIWQVNGPAQALAIAALNDTPWQQRMIKIINDNALHTQQYCQPLTQISEKIVHSDLFSSYFMSTDKALTINQHLAQHGVLTRVVLFDKQPEKITNTAPVLFSKKDNSSNAILRVGRISKNDAFATNKLSQSLNSLLNIHGVLS